ncbi:SMI1/KNR4 family protein [Streptomyces tendae]|uniref:SMI1/KNR4 family protein n=1 Tax=Streptomyces tendae TaxID=1932 RepID=UPI0033B6F2D4
MTDEPFENVLEQLDNWLQDDAPADFAALNPPAAQERIEEITGRRFALHSDLVTWLQRHDGVSAATGHGGPGVILPGGFVLHTAEGMRDGQRWMEEGIAEWIDENESEDPDLRDIYEGVYGYLFHVRWVPIASNVTGGKLLVDHRPGDGFGNVLYGLEAGDTDGPVKIWDNLHHMFRELLAALTEGAPIRSVDAADPQTPAVVGEGAEAYITWAS